MSGQRAQRLEKLGMVWSPADERFQENLQAAKAYHEQHWTLCTPRTATAFGSETSAVTTILTTSVGALAGALWLMNIDERRRRGRCRHQQPKSTRILGLS